jgi:nondiscriminating glutamyl-tRNA synthetase
MISPPCARISKMRPQENTSAPAAATNVFNAGDVAAILREQNWLAGEPSPEQRKWCEHAAELLGPQASDRASLLDLLQLVFHYDAHEILAKVESHSVLARYGARDVIRQLALLLLDPAPLTSDRFKEIINTLKDTLGLRSRELFHPIRLALTGRAGEGELDRVILLLDEAAAIPFAVHAKPARERIVEFCAALD